MRRLLRWAFNLAAAVSAVLFVAACVLWVWSYRVALQYYEADGSANDPSSATGR